MAKSKSLYICSECGYESAKWYGKCPGCGEWNTMNEQVVSVSTGSSKAKRNSVAYATKVMRLNEISGDIERRISTGVSEFDRVLGGGIVEGSLVLISGDPGIGKSTILLQICEHLGKSRNVLYVSGEESASQIKLRAGRLGVTTENLGILAETDIGVIVETIKTSKPDVVIIDSIQTMVYDEISSTAGSITQVRECTNILMHLAKSLEIPILVVGHVNKDGAIAGPKVLEHIVDTVLYFEGERNYSYRILRGVKNRFGSTNEIGVFEMKQNGLQEVENPSLLMLSGRPKNVSGTCVACVMEGSRPILAEVQGLVTATGFGTPRRMSTGFDYNRMAMILAVLEKRAGYYFNSMDTYINVIGGLRLDEPAADLTVAMALVSSLKDIVVKDDIIAFGEIGLAGEIRAVNNCEQRISESVRLGFDKCIIPFHNYKGLSKNIKVSADIVPVRSVREAFNAITE
ncbi:MAG TPA: DNA repair protein RadA [Candidatus Eubacterium faecale]|uniref:DNA repair protein RadA n=1 Tax=Candidatus Eubacterium faecale TaxID=2838568 RepID=A0A9D2MIB8_9FIRM|nr:DNA repair protein RadA [Candidatus Eubacterium faecale]